MIRCMDRTVVLETKHTSYVLHADAVGNLLHLYYGEKWELQGDWLQAILPRVTNPNGCSIVADPQQPAVSLDDACLEISTLGKGDFREPFVTAVYADGGRTLDFRFVGVRLCTDAAAPEGLPGARPEIETEELVTAVVTLADAGGLQLELFYTVYAEADCITRFARVSNTGAAPCVIERLMSAQLDLRWEQARVTSFHGDWAREMQPHVTELTGGAFVSGAVTGCSSNRANPFFLCAEPDAGETHGQCYAMNLIYSGNHRELVQMGTHGTCRMLTGIHPEGFSWVLAPGESLDAPQAVLTWSGSGCRGISRNMHDFVRRHIVRGYWQYRERPILINSWEAMYFDISERRLLKLAEAAKKTGIELFVLDDGWFGRRKDDTSSLGDWYDNTEKLPGGLAGLSGKIRAMGLQFGIWVEPEMVSEDSDLFRAHPDWAVRHPGRAHALGRNQMILDLTREDVQNYLIETMADVFTRSRADYVKWDMNRQMTDCFSQALPAERQGEFCHRYMLGLYRVMGELTGRFPQILFEGCASGGNRFDLGILSYFPQIWASDCTDALMRGRIQEGISYGYPQSVVGAHVSASPNHQTLRRMPLETRFAIACAGVLGYECNLSDLSPRDLAEMKTQVALYQAYRRTLQFGRFYRLPRMGTDHVRWLIVAQDQSQAVGIVMQGQCLPNNGFRRFCTVGLAPDAMYRFVNRSLKYDIRRMGDLVNTAAPIHVKQDSVLHGMVARFVKLDGETEDLTVPGSLLNTAGITLAQAYAGTGLAADTALYQDHDARVFLLDRV